jgi:hypothetical protein
MLDTFYGCSRVEIDYYWERDWFEELQGLGLPEYVQNESNFIFL